MDGWVGSRVRVTVRVRVRIRVIVLGAAAKSRDAGTEIAARVHESIPHLEPKLAYKPVC